VLLIDCYNVLHTTMPPMLAGLDEGRLCEALARTAWASRGIVVVADGRPKPLRAQTSPVDEVELLFSGPTRTADSVIIDMINDHTAPRRVTVVSTDRQIRAAARRRRCTAWTSEQFITRLVEQLRGGAAGQPGPGKPTQPLEDHETDAWLAEFGVDPDAGPPSPYAPGGTDADAPDEDDPFDIPGVWPPPGM